MREDIIVLHARDAGKALKAVAGEDLAWLYLGQDISERERIARRLGGEKRYYTGSLLQETAHEQKQPFLDFMAGLGKKRNNRLYWWATDTAYRNPLTSDLFLLWCYASLLGKLSIGAGYDGKRPLIVIVQDRWLYKALWQRYGVGKGFDFLCGKTVWQDTLLLNLKLAVVRVQFLFRAFRYYLASWRMRPQSQPDSGTKDQVYLYSWIQERSFTKDGDFQDAYFGRLPDILKEDGNSVSYLTPPFLPNKLKQKCRDFKSFDFMFLDSCYTLGNIFKSVFSCPGIRHKGEEKWVGTLLRRQELHEGFFQNHLAYYYAFGKWLRESATEKATVIYPFENQPWEKMLCLAAAKSGKDIKLVAYQHSTIPSLVLNYFTEKGEAEIMPLPDVIVVDSDRALKTLKDTGFGAVPIVNGGALRFEYLLEQKSNRIKKRKGRPQTVLVTLPYMTDLVQELLLAVFAAFAGLKDSPGVMIKFHPASSPKNLRIRLPEWPAHFEQTEKPVPDLFDEIDLAVCCSANVIIEMSLAGIPTVRYRSEHALCLDELEGLDEKAVRSCYEKDMQNVVLSVLSGKDVYPTRDISRDIAGFFGPVDEQVWRDVVKFK